MVTIEQRAITKHQWVNLERTVAALDIRLQSIQWGLQRSTPGSLVEHFRSFLRLKQGSRFMSTVCNQQIRSNTKVANHDSPRA
jgi:hypothetical protein